MKIVMISGWVHSGKDTAADRLIEKGFRRIGFADHLKDLAATEYGVPRSHFDDRKFKETPILSLPVAPKDAFSRMLSEYLVKEFRDTHGVRPHGFVYQGDEFYGRVMDGAKEIWVRVYQTPRSLAITKGSTNRFVDSAYWIKKAAEIMQNDPDGLYVISDARYKSEMDQVINLVGKSNVRTLRVNRYDTTESTDSSERDLDDYKFDVVIENRGTLEEYLAKVDAFVESGL